MAKTTFETPRIPDFPEIPVIVEGAMAHSRPFVAAPDHQQALGFPGELVDDWHDVAIAKMGELLGKYRGLRVFLDSCVKCGACTDKCHYYLGTADPKNMPVARQDLLRKVYRRHFTLAGRLFPKLVGAADLTEEVLEDWYRYFHQCSQCRRCSVFCPYGIDTAEVSMAGREILASVGLGQKYSNEIIGKVHKIGNNLGLPQPALADTLEGLEEDVEDETGVTVRFPLDEEGAEVLLVTPSADFFAEPHVDGLIGYAKVFHQAGIRWTLSTTGLGSGELRALHRQLRQHAQGGASHPGGGAGARSEADRVRRVRARVAGRVQLPPHAGGAVRLPRPALSGPAACRRGHSRPHPPWRAHPRQDRQRRAPRHLPRFLQRRPRIAHGRCPRRAVHAAPGRAAHSLQPLLRHGAGHHRGEHFLLRRRRGLLTDDLVELRVKGALPRMQAFKEVAERNRVTHIAAICAICKSQFAKVLPYYGFEMDQILSVHQLVGDAIVLGGSD